MTTRFDAYVEEVLNTVRWSDELTADEIAAQRDAMRARVVAELEAGKFIPAPIVRRWKRETVDGQPTLAHEIRQQITAGVCGQ